MPKKRVGVSLRKPSPAPEFVPGSVAAAGEALASEALASSSEASDVAVDGTPSAVSMSAGTMSAGAMSAGAMSGDIMSGDITSSSAEVGHRHSDIVALREATPEPAPAEIKAIEAFVNGAAGAFERAASEIPPAQLAEVLRRGPAGYRELVVYLPEELARDLSLHCLEHDLDMSRLVASALERHLERSSSPAPAAARRFEDAPASEGLLSLAARVLRAELTAWARAVWARRRAAGVAAAAS